MNRSDNMREVARVWNGSERGKEHQRQHCTEMNKTERHKEAAREVGRKIGKLYGKFSLINFIGSNKHREVVRQNRQNRIAYNKSEKGRENARKGLAKTRLLITTESQKKLSRTLLVSGVYNVMEFYVSGIRRLIDIAIPFVKVAIEVDGSSHNGLFCTKQEKIEDDRLKDQQLQSLDWRVLRFTNQEVSNSLETVVERVKQVIETQEMKDCSI